MTGIVRPKAKIKYSGNNQVEIIRYKLDGTELDRRFADMSLVTKAVDKINSQRQNLENAIRTDLENRAAREMYSEPYRD